MSLHEVFVQQTNEKTKGRKFSCRLLTLIPKSKDNKSIRPSIAIFCGSQLEVRYIQANLRMGSKLKVSSSYIDEIHFLKSEPYQMILEKNNSLHTLTVYDPRITTLSDGFLSNSDEIAFCCPISKNYIEQNKVYCPSEIGNFINSFIRLHINEFNKNNLYKSSEKGLLAYVFDKLNDNLEKNYVLCKRFVQYLENKSTLPILRDDCFEMYLFASMLLTSSLRVASKDYREIADTLNRSSYFDYSSIINETDDEYLMFSSLKETFENRLAEITKEYIGLTNIDRDCL